MSKMGNQTTSKGNSPLKSKAWLSNGIESLYARQNDTKEEIIFDVLIIGSGYGGAIAASELSALTNTKRRIAVLERGREFLPGSFPSNVNEAPKELRKSAADGSKPQGNLEGLFDIRTGDDLNIIQANGLGGGSLINAGVMARANDTVFERSEWPEQINAHNLAPYYAEAEEGLGATIRDGKHIRPNTIFEHPDFIESNGPAKYQSLKRLSQGSKKRRASQYFKSANITVNMTEGHCTSGGIALNPCNLCGDCASGCNNNSKISLDKNHLAKAHQQGVELFTGVTVNKVSKDDEQLWSVHTVYTNSALRSRQRLPEHIIKAKKIILAAGALGSTEILKRSQTEHLAFSQTLGRQFSSNGDMMLVGYEQNQEANAVADAFTKHSERKIGPTITGMIDLRGHADAQQQMVIQEMAVPAAASHVFTELYSVSAAIRNIWRTDFSAHHDGSHFNDPASVRPETLRKTSLYAAMGDDGAKGILDFKHQDSKHNEGTLHVEWETLRQNELFDRQLETLSSLAGDSSNTKKNKGLGGTVIGNPFWQLLKPESMDMLNLKKGPPLTVHPLGGCPMGDSVISGVTNHQGRVFDAASDGFHDGLMVLDGAIIPGAVGINPALTISAVCLKALRELIAEQHFDPTSNTAAPTLKERTRPPEIRSIKHLEADAIKPRKDTKVTITERLVGMSKLENDHGEMHDVVIEISLLSKSLALKNFSEPSAHQRPEKTKLIIDANKIEPTSGLPFSKIRIYYLADWQALRSEEIPLNANQTGLDNAAQFVGRLNGHLIVLGRAKSFWVSRVIKSAYAWLLNRGIRDLAQSWKPLDCEIDAAPKMPKSIQQRALLFCNSFTGLFKSFSQAGEIRTLQYELSVPEVFKRQDFSYFLNDTLLNNNQHTIIGTKRLSYSRRSNPWLQLSVVHLEALPNSPSHQNDAKRLRRLGNTLSLDLNYLAKVDAPLLQVCQQENQVQTLTDLASFGGYITRMLLGIHFYSFRAPETPAPRNIKRNACEPQLPTPDVIPISVGFIPDDSIASLSKNEPVHIKLTYYAQPKPSKPPVLMIHGYSASSTTFAHHSLEHSLTRFCYEQGRDVWLLDLRTSCDFKSARYPWTFEDVAENDIPVAIEHIFRAYNGLQKIDVITHCMGSIMLGMSILKPSALRTHGHADFFQKRLNRIVFSQATPAIKFTQDNNFRSFVTRYLKELVPDDYQFQPEGNGPSKLLDQMLDRVLYTLPYPTKEYDLLNAVYTPLKRAHYARTRHRMDAFFTRTFELNNVSQATLDCIDDFFGPIHVNTLIQASQFANNNVATDSQGRNNYLSLERLHRYWGTIPTMSFHSKNNGLVDYSTGERTKRIFQEAGIPYHNVLIENDQYGHQDAIISPNAHRDVFPHISDFLDGKYPSPSKASDTETTTKRRLVIEPPSYGPLIIKPSQGAQPSRLRADHIRIAFGSNHARATQPQWVFLPVKRTGKHLELVCENEQTTLELIDDCLALSQQPITTEPTWWHTADVPQSMFNVNNADGLAVFLVYDDLISLCPDNTPSSLPPSPALQASLAPTISQALARFFNHQECLSHVYSQGLIEWTQRPSNTLSFALGSCQYPGGMLDKQIAYRSYELLDQCLVSTQANKPHFMVLMGDQIYADATAGLLDPSTPYDQYNLPYLQLYKQPHVRSVLRKLPSYNMLDDHELSDNWEPVTNNTTASKKLNTTRQLGVNAFLKYQRGEEQVTDQNGQIGSLWYTFQQQKHDFFVCDSRTQRTARTAENIDHKDTTLLGCEQHLALEKWLQKPTQRTPRFVLSSSIFLPRHVSLHGSGERLASAIRVDSWDGYPMSLHRTLAFLVDQKIDQTVFLSGDDHVACFAEISITNLNTSEKVHAYSAHCPGLYTPFPFANARIDDFEGLSNNVEGTKHSEFHFVHERHHYCCTVKANFNQANDQKMTLGPIDIEILGGFLLINTR